MTFSGSHEIFNLRSADAKLDMLDKPCPLSELQLWCRSVAYCHAQPRNCPHVGTFNNCPGEIKVSILNGMNICLLKDLSV